MNAYGKTSKKLAALGERVLEIRHRQREMSFERTQAERELEDLRRQRQEAAIAAEMVVIDGKPQPKSPKLAQLTAKVEKLERELAPQAWAAKRAALQRTLAQREQEQEQFVREHRDELLVELERADLDATEAMAAAYAGLLHALERREEVARDLDSVLRHFPPLYEGSNAYPQARHHVGESTLRSEIRERLRKLEPTMPPELTGEASDKAGTGQPPVAAGGRVASRGFEDNVEGEA